MSEDQEVILLGNVDLPSPSEFEKEFAEELKAKIKEHREWEQKAFEKFKAVTVLWY